MPKIAVFGGTGYLASLIKNQNKVKKINTFFFQEKRLLTTILIIYYLKKI